MFECTVSKGFTSFDLTEHSGIHSGEKPCNLLTSAICICTNVVFTVHTVGHYVDHVPVH